MKSCMLAIHSCIIMPSYDGDDAIFVSCSGSGFNAECLDAGAVAAGQEDVYRFGLLLLRLLNAAKSSSSRAGSVLSDAWQLAMHCTIQATECRPSASQVSAGCKALDRQQESSLFCDCCRFTLAFRSCCPLCPDQLASRGMTQLNQCNLSIYRNYFSVKYDCWFQALDYGL